MLKIYKSRRCRRFVAAFSPLKSLFILNFTNGKINVGGTDYVYDSWSYTENEDGCFYTFQLNTSDPLVNPEKIGTDKSSQLASVGEQVDYQGVAYYLEQMNEWVRDYASAYNKIYGQEGATDYYETEDRQGAIFFTGMNAFSSLANAPYNVIGNIFIF